VKRTAWWLKSLYELQLRTIQASPRVFCDETPMPVLDPGRRRTRICQFWAHAVDDRPWGRPSPPAIAYVFADGRGTEDIAGQLASFPGILQVDGYAAYKALARGQGAIRLSCSRPTQICRGVQDDAVAVRARGDRTPAGGLCHRGGDPRQQCGGAAPTKAVISLSDQDRMPRRLLGTRQ
jgi:hypothetical protein